MLYILQGEIKMETVLGILFLVQFTAFIGIIICIAYNYENQLKDAETKEQAEEIANKLKICLKDMIIKEKYKELQSAYAKIEILEEEIKKLKKRKKSK